MLFSVCIPSHAAGPQHEVIPENCDWLVHVDLEALKQGTIGP